MPATMGGRMIEIWPRWFRSDQRAGNKAIKPERVDADNGPKELTDNKHEVVVTVSWLFLVWCSGRSLLPCGHQRFIKGLEFQQLSAPVNYGSP